MLREAARAEAGAGLVTAVALLEEASALVDDPGERAEIALEVAEAYAALFRWVDAVEVLERALGELADGNGALAARLEGELVVSGLHDARGAGRARAVLARLASRAPSGAAGEALAVAQGMVRFVTGHPAGETAPPLEAALAAAGPGVENWDTRAALLWVLVACERFDAVDAALVALEAEVKRSGSARGLVAVYSTLGLLRLRLGALPEADAAARVALAVLQEGDFAPGSASRRPCWPTSLSRPESSTRPTRCSSCCPRGLAAGCGHGADPGGARPPAARPGAAGRGAR